MITNKVVAPNILALYTWELLSNNTSMQLINGKIPVIPFDDDPLMSDADAPYLIYGFSEAYNTGIREVQKGVFSLRISARTAAEMNEILTVISTAFNEGDTTASHINAWSSTNPDLVGITFGYAKAILVEGAEGSETENGPLYGLINIDYRYVRDTSNSVSQFHEPTGTWKTPIEIWEWELGL
jgi:hypothetical protein